MNRDTRQVPEKVTQRLGLPTVFGVQRREARVARQATFDPLAVLTAEEKEIVVDISGNTDAWVTIHDSPFQNANAGGRFAAFFIASLLGENPELTPDAKNESIEKARNELASNDPYEQFTTDYWERTLEQMVFLCQLALPRAIPHTFMPDELDIERVAHLLEASDTAVHYGFLLLLDPSYTLSTFAQWRGEALEEVKEEAIRDVHGKKEDIRNVHNRGLSHIYNDDLYQYVRYAALTRLILGEKDWKEKVVFINEDWEIITQGMQVMRESSPEDKVFMFALYASMIAAETIDISSGGELTIVMEEAQIKDKKEEGGIPAMLDF